ncbi:MAG: hypothetical protein M3Z16_09700 [Pseudomonadota bacterium]|nr:hypothetical protein [Pseudomonadota bacterium]
MMNVLRLMVLLLPLSVALPVSAQTGRAVPARAAATPALEGFVLERVPRLAFGVTLNFSVFGSEGAEVMVYVQGVRELLPLREVQAGVYEGSHVIRSGDAPRADSEVVATMQRGGQTVRATLAEPLLISAVAAPWSQADSGLAAVPMIAPGPSPIALADVPPALAQRAAPLNNGPALASAVARACAACLVVESIRQVPAPPPADLGGKVARALDEHHQRVLGVLDAVGLPFAGREKQRLVERDSEFEVVLRSSEGRTLIRRFSSRPPLHVGDQLPPAAAPSSRAANF